MEKIQDGEFNAIQFYLKSADRDTWSDKQTVEHTLNIKDPLSNASARIINGETLEQETPNLKDAKD